MVLAAQALLTRRRGDRSPSTAPSRRALLSAPTRMPRWRATGHDRQCRRGAVQVVLNVTGNPIGLEPAVSQGYTVERSYYKLDGTQVEPEQVRQNERLVTVLKVTEREGRDGRLLLVDRLPAGFEIDNPELVDSGTVAALDWLKTEVEPAHTEYRDDRFVAAFDRGTPISLRSSPWPTSCAPWRPGRYVHPPALVEDMYAPERFGRTAFGTVEVVRGAAEMGDGRGAAAFPGSRRRRRVAASRSRSAASVPVGGARPGSPARPRTARSRRGRGRSTVVLDRDGRLLRPFATADGRWRLPIETADVDPRFLAMLKAYEDGRFEQHRGVDPLALARAGAQLLRQRPRRLGRFDADHAGGAPPRAAGRAERERETPPDRRGPSSSERRLTKDEILRLYLTLAPYGGNLEGTRAASLAYFGREPKRLSFAEAALLVALPQAPEARRPDRFPEAARVRRNPRPRCRSAKGLLTSAEAVAAKAEPLPAGRRPSR